MRVLPELRPSETRLTPFHNCGQPILSFSQPPDGPVFLSQAVACQSCSAAVVPVVPLRSGSGFSFAVQTAPPTCGLRIHAGPETGGCCCPRSVWFPSLFVPSGPSQPNVGMPGLAIGRPDMLFLFCVPAAGGRGHQILRPFCPDIALLLLIDGRGKGPILSLLWAFFTHFGSALLCSVLFPWPSRPGRSFIAQICANDSGFYVHLR